MEADPSFIVSGPVDPLLRAAALRATVDVASIDFDVTALYREHRRRLLGLATAITLDAGVAEEVAHEAFIGLHRHAVTVENPVLPAAVGREPQRQPHPATSGCRSTSGCATTACQFA